MAYSFYISCCKSWIHLFYNFSNVLSENFKEEGMHLQIALGMMAWRNPITSASKISYTNHIMASALRWWLLVIIKSYLLALLPEEKLLH